jgi:hypothetical protein
MKFTLTIDTDNAAFDDGNLTLEVSAILEEAAKRVYDGSTEGSLLDGNGNTVGAFSLT